MIKEFEVENYLSFKERQKISFEATADKTAEEYLVYTITHPITGANTRILRANVVYGANASGKTNILIAIERIFRLMFTPMIDISDEITHIPFAANNSELTEMKVVFFIDGVEYSYEIKYDKIIHSEELLFNPNGAKSLLYRRSYDVDKQIPIVTFGDNANLDSKTRKDITLNTYNNHTVISTLNKITIYAPQLQKIIDWIKISVKDFNTGGQISVEESASIIVDMMQDDAKKAFLMEYINSADFNINNIYYEEKNLEIPEEIKAGILENNSISDEQKKRLISRRSIKVDIEHLMDNEKVKLPLSLESRGTFASIDLANKFYDIMNSRCVYIIDEIDNTLHYDLLTFYLQKFLINKHNSQLIFSTHNQVLLDETFIRRDMVWFTKKDATSAATEVYSAADFKLHKNASLYNAYKTGKLGAKPSVGSPFINIIQLM